jgi:hypothetical protein
MTTVTLIVSHTTYFQFSRPPYWRINWKNLRIKFMNLKFLYFMYVNEIELNQKLAVCLRFVFKSSLRLDHMECIILSMWFFICLPCYFLHVDNIRLWAKQLTSNYTSTHLKKTLAFSLPLSLNYAIISWIKSPFSI